MAKKYNGTINFASALRPTGAQPLDDRMVVQSLTDLMSFATFEAEGASAAYNGMMVAVIEEQKVFMLVDAANLTSEDSWVAVGSGNGSLAVETYGEAIALASDENIGQVIYVKTKSEYDADGEEGELEAVEYEAAPYIVIGTGKLMKLAASTASGDVTADVAELQTKVSSLETAVGKDGEEPSGLYKVVADAVAEAAQDAQDKADDAQEAAEATAAAALSAYKGEMSIALGGKVDKTTYDEKVQAIESAISGKVAQGDFDTLEGRVDTAEGEIDALQTAIATKAEAQALADGLATKVDKAEGYRLMSEAEGTKLKGIAEGAQVNKIEKIIFNGTEAIVDTQNKSVTLTTPVDYITGLGADEKVLSVVDGKLASTLSLNYYKGTNEEGTSVYEIQLVGNENTVVGRIDAKDFVKDGMLNNVELKKNPENKPAGTYLVFTWNNEAGTTEPMYVPVTDLIDVYEEGNGIALDGKKFSVNLKAGEEFLEVTEAGLATKGIATAITEAKNEVVGDAETDTKDSLTLQGVKKYAADQASTAQSAAEGVAATKADEALESAKGYVDAIVNDTVDADGQPVKGLESRISELEGQDVYVKTAVDQQIANAQSGAEQTAAAALATYASGMTETLATKADVDKVYTKEAANAQFVAQEGYVAYSTEEKNKLAAIENGAEVNVIESVSVNNVAAELDGKTAKVSIEAKNMQLGTDITTDGKENNGLEGEESNVVYSAESYIPTVLQGIYQSIRSAVAGGVNSVTASDTSIEVNSADANNPKVGVRVEASTEQTVSEGHIELVKGANGLYGAMYYEGDDAE